MRLPFLQLESDLLAHGAAGVAALLDCSVPQALGHIALLRAWAVSRGPTDAPPDGWVPGDNAVRLVAAGAQWKGDAGMFVAALADPGVGLVEVRPDGICVLGMGPYAEAWEKNTKARERLRKFRERNAYETRTNDDRNANVSGQTQTQTQTQTQIETTTPPTPSRGAVSAGPPGELGDQIAAVMRAEVDATWSWTAQRERELGNVMRQPEATQGEILRRLRIAVRTNFPRFTGLQSLARNWEAYARPEPTKGPAPPSEFSAPTPYVQPAWLDPNFGKE